MASLRIINNYSILLNGNTHTGKQGDADDGFSDEKVITTTGPKYSVEGTIPTATVYTLWDEDSNFPATWVYMFFWCDVTVRLQLIAQGSNVEIQVTGEVPFVMSGNSILAAATTTLISGGAQSTLSTIDSIGLGNYSGGSGTYKLDLFL